MSGSTSGNKGERKELQDPKWVIEGETARHGSSEHKYNITDP